MRQGNKILQLKEFDYKLPSQLIAQYPSEKRDESRLLVLRRDSRRIEHRIFKDIVQYFQKDDLLVLNDTKVIPARIFGRKESGGKVEILILNVQGSSLKVQGKEFEVLVRPGRGCKVGTRLIFGDGKLTAGITRVEEGRRFLRFDCNGKLEGLLERLGKMPLPPYVKREAFDSDKDRYQTVYAEKKGAVAAPTAGLHFTDNILKKISEKGVDIEYVTLHVGHGTFRPVKCEDISEHKMHKEYFEIEKAVVDKIDGNKGRTVAVGTTTSRVLETVFGDKGQGARDTGKALKDSTNLFIYPGYNFKVVDVLLTNFHLPKSTLLMLVSAFCGRELLFNAYQEAIREKYRFYSYGDAMLII